MWDKDMSLTDVLCKKALPQEKQYRLSDINGLSLRIDPNGKKYWSIRYTENGQRKSKALGVYPELSLKAFLDSDGLLRKEFWWRWRELNPRPPALRSRILHA